MKLIKPSFEIIEPTSYDLDGMYKHIELCGRTCYKSTDKITPESATPFVDRMYKSQHWAMLEHGTVYLKASNPTCWVLSHYYGNNYSNYTCLGENEIVTTNFRVIVENNWIDDLKYMCEPTRYHAKRHTVKFICNRQVSHEFVRHRVFSFAQESTRYCNYTKGKFGNELTFIIPCWLPDLEEGQYESDWDGDENTNTWYWGWYNGNRLLSSKHDALLWSLWNIEDTYKGLIEEDWKPQQAATILPNALKTELIMTGFEEDWKHFFDLRALGTTGAPHPQAQELAKPLMKEFINRGYLKATNEEI